MKHQLPRDLRISHSRRGELTYKDTRFPCLIQDISVGGLFIISARDAEIGQEMQVMFDLTPGHFYRATIRVEHVDNGCFGAAIIGAEPQDAETFRQFVEKRFKELRAE
jgi:hypothetical protein